MWPNPDGSSTFKGHLGHPSGTMSCHRGLREQPGPLPPWPGAAAAGGTVVSGCYKQERRNSRQINSFHTQVTAFGSSGIPGKTPKAGPGPGTACGNAVLSRAKVLNSSLSHHSDLSITFRVNLRGQNTCLRAQNKPKPVPV